MKSSRLALAAAASGVIAISAWGIVVTRDQGAHERLDVAGETANGLDSFGARIVSADQAAAAPLVPGYLPPGFRRVSNDESKFEGLNGTVVARSYSQSYARGDEHDPDATIYLAIVVGSSDQFDSSPSSWLANLRDTAPSQAERVQERRVRGGKLAYYLAEGTVDGVVVWDDGSGLSVRGGGQNIEQNELFKFIEELRRK